MVEGAVAQFYFILLSEKSKVWNGMLMSDLCPSMAGNSLGGAMAFFKESN
jgi:hypothetical protein